MASVVLTPWVFLNDVADPSDWIRLIAHVSETTSQPSAFRRYAGGRVRSITRPGSLATFAVEIPWPSRDEIDDIRRRFGRVHLLRHPGARKVYGQFFDFDVSPYPKDVPSAVSFTFHEVTWSEDLS